MSASGPVRYKVTCELVVEVERPEALPEQARHALERDGVPLAPGWDDISNPYVAALQSLIDPAWLVEPLEGIAFVEAVWHAEELDPPTPWT